MKKFLTVLISAILLMSLLPMTAFADNTSPLSGMDSDFINQAINSYTSGDAKIDIAYALSNGESISAEGINELTIIITNNGNALYDSEVELGTPAGVTIQSGSTKRDIGIILPNETKEVSFPIICSKDIKAGSYAFSIKFDGNVSNYPKTLNLLKLLADWGATISKDDTTGNWSFDYSGQVTALGSFLANFAKSPVETSDTFFVPVTVTEETSTDSYATPRLMLTNYNCGGNIQAGQNFGLGLTLRNTSKEDLYNIKVTIDTGGKFVSVGSSSSYFIEGIKAGESSSKSLTFGCSRDIPQGQYPITVVTSYEDKDGKEFTGSDAISVPVVQETRLVVDDILDPGWLTMSDAGYVTVNYRNMGNNTINNLTVKVEGDFTVEGNNVYYVGNLLSGKSDSYSFSFYPEAEGNCHGTVIFTYEDAEGYEHHINKEFNFNIGPAYDWDNPQGEEVIPEVQTGLPKWAKIAIPVAAVALIVVVIIVLKKIKNKKQEALDLDE